LPGGLGPVRGVMVGDGRGVPLGAGRGVLSGVIVGMTLAVGLTLGLGFGVGEGVGDFTLAFRLGIVARFTGGTLTFALKLKFESNPFVFIIFMFGGLVFTLMFAFV